MYGDFSRLVDPRSGRYSAVLAQQGRFLLDADLNEQTAIVLDYLRQLATDLLGPFAGPVDGAGFQVGLVLDETESRCHAVTLTPGHYYVYGLRCEAPELGRRPTDHLRIGEHPAPFVVYLVVWEETVGATQRPELAEPALGPAVPDTTRRSRVRWRPRAAKKVPGSDEDVDKVKREELVAAFERHNADTSRRPLLAARAHASKGGDGLPPVFRGESQLYRVEVHHGGPAEEATFKWSRDNGSVELGLESLSTDDEGGMTAVLRSVWPDARRGLEIGDWVELVDDHWAPLGTPGPLLRVERVSLAKREIGLRAAPLPEGERPPATSEGLHPFLRRWDQDPDDPAPDHAIPLSRAVGHWFELEDGVQVRFETEGAHYERGDFWLIPARSATRDLLWPHRNGSGDGPPALPPNGPARYLAPLALVSSLSKPPVDLRARFDYRVAEPEPAAAPPPPEPVVSPAAPAAPAAVAAEPEPLPPPDPAESTGIVAPKATFRLRSTSVVLEDDTFDLAEGTTTVGRAADADIQIPDDDVSRHQATLTIDGDHLTIEDVGSRNGTFVNEERIEPGTPAELQPGDVIKLSTDAVQLVVEET